MADLPYGQRILAWAGCGVPAERFVAVGGVRLSEKPDLDWIQDRLDTVVSRHPVLGAGPVLLADVDDVWAAASAASYPPESPCLLWAYVNGCELLLVAHHTVSDPWSIRVLIRDVLQGNGTPAPSYRHEVSVRHLRRMPRAVPFWEHALADVPTLTTDGGSGEPETTRELRIRTDITLAQADAVGRAARSTAFVALFAAFAHALQPLSPGRDLVIPVLTYGRDRSEWDTVGLYMNVLPVRLTTTDLPAVQQAFIEAYAQEIPFPVLVETMPAAGAAFARGGPALAQFEVIQVPADEGIEPLTIPAGLGLGGPILPVNGLAFWLELGSGGVYTVCLRYRDDLYRESGMRALVQRFVDTWGDLYAAAS
ncbi:condensation domain-containing protein [Micromonospora foliorum]|uniref:condensation domain-containing protein n=1 Tax=Micromonospora foliorum TaxID=2911210 RepID=UPI001EE806EE|nr:condensation domain-containing protein [Micromonospora foliorum]MCG5439828.1 condensation domain-containing protein [Micromonospora foliorum]